MLPFDSRVFHLHWCLRATWWLFDAQRWKACKMCKYCIVEHREALSSQHTAHSYANESPVDCTEDGGDGVSLCWNWDERSVCVCVCVCMSVHPAHSRSSIGEVTQWF